jgi:hypothetical protein
MKKSKLGATEKAPAEVSKTSPNKDDEKKPKGTATERKLK